MSDDLRAFGRSLNIRQRRHERHGFKWRALESDCEIKRLGFRRKRMHENAANPEHFGGLDDAL